MLFAKADSIEDFICDLLQFGSVDATALIAQIQEQRPKTTKQGVYAALRRLRQMEIVVMHRKKVSFNVLWLRRAGQFLAITEQHYAAEGLGRDSFLNLKDGENIVYSFSSPAETDKFWGHALILLGESSVPDNEPAYLYNPHEWFLIARQESERECIAIISRRRRFLLAVGGKTSLDRVVANEFDGDRSQYLMLERPLFPKDNYYLNIVGDFLIEVWIDPSIAIRIEEIYRGDTRDRDLVRSNLVAIVDSKGRSKLKISRNAKRAKRLKKLLKNGFYVSVKG